MKLSSFVKVRTIALASRRWSLFRHCLLAGFCPFLVFLALYRHLAVVASKSTIQRSPFQIESQHKWFKTLLNRCYSTDIQN